MPKTKKPPEPPAPRTLVAGVRLSPKIMEATKAKAASRGQSHASYLAWLIQTHSETKKP
jgi:predicted DNA binding CopG/RHH family protein